VTERLLVQPEAEADLAEAYRWYEAQRAGLGLEFLAAVDRALERIADQPLRRRRLSRHPAHLLAAIPYVVFHVMRSDRVHVLAVLHERRNPRIARNRVSRFEGG